jgi:hypothetical protein
MSEDPLDKLGTLITEAKLIAKEYRTLTGRPLGITGEVAEYEACRLLGLEIAPVREAGYDAIEPSTNRKMQIKGRCILDNSKPGQRIGRIDRTKEWDAVLLVLLDQDFEPLSIFEAEREVIEAALSAPGSKARNERGQLGVRKFRKLGRVVWDASTAF